MIQRADIEEMLRLAEACKEGKANWLPVWQDVTNYVVPRRGDWLIINTSGKQPTVKVYDSSAIAALNLLVDGLQGYLVSQAVDWFKMGLDKPEQEKLPGVQAWLEGVERVLYATFNRSNFYEAMNEFLTDGCSIGTAVLFVEDDVANQRPLYSTRHLKEINIAESRTGSVDTVYREYIITNRQAAQQWPNGLSPRRRESVERDPYADCNILHVVRPRDDYRTGKIDSMNKPWESIYVDKDELEPLEEGGYDMFPYLVWRFRKNSDELYGRSPAIDALPVILRLNQVARTTLQAAQLAVEPPLNIPAAMKGNEKIVPRGFNYYTNPAEVITPINLASNYPIGKDQEKELQEQIREIFRTKIFLLMEQLTKGPYTATEIRDRQGKNVAVLWAPIGRFNSECLVPLIERTYAICEKNGQIPLPPQALKKARFKISFIGPLAQSQKRYHESQGVTQGLAFIGPIAQLNPEALDNVNWDEVVRAGMENAGMPQSTIRELAAVVKLRRDRAAAAKMQQDQAMKAEQMKSMIGAAGKLNQPVMPGSMLEQITKQAGGGMAGRGAA